MIKNYFKTALRTIVKRKTISYINISGLAVGMAVTILIGLWIWDELSYNKKIKNYDHISQVMQNQTFNGEIQTWGNIPMPLGPELLKIAGSDFKHVILSGSIGEHKLSVSEKKFMKSGTYMQPGVTDMLSLKMLKGNRSGLQDMNSVMLSASVSKSIFGEADPTGEIITIDGKAIVKVTGVYEDLPTNSSFADLGFVAPWDLFVKTEQFDKILRSPWGASWFQAFAQINDNTDFNIVSKKIKDARSNNIDKESAAKNKPEIFLYPMSKWHLYDDFKNGVAVGGRILYVWLFGIIGLFVLILACINFMNLSTAISEKRAKEVGIRKAIGSIRKQLIYQFFIESLTITFFAFVCSLALVQLFLPFFNSITGKPASVPFTNPFFWLAGLSFCVITGIVAGSYPAFYLSSFKPVKVLKGIFRAGPGATIPRKILVVLQFTVSVILIIGTIVVYRQVQFARNRPIGYNHNSLATINSGNIHNHFQSFRDELIKTGAVLNVAESELPVTNTYITNSGFDWKGKDPAMQEEFVTLGVTHDFGNTAGWQIVDGRDFSKDFASDSAAIILNEEAVKYLGFQHPVGETILWGKNERMHIIGVVKNMITQNPYDPIKQTFFYLRNGYLGTINIRINPNSATKAALASIEAVFKKYNPDEIFEFRFADEEYGKKFSTEERVGRLAALFTILAIFISCLGLFGMASFITEQRTKEIGVRKVLGASVLNLWGLLSKEFVLLVGISLLLAIPAAYYFMHTWLLNYEYRTEISGWIFVIAGSGALIITILTVSFQSIKAALMNPVKALRSE
jgi:ABC-type antimicrobial peptide transport system permease subunit